MLHFGGNRRAEMTIDPTALQLTPGFDVHRLVLPVTLTGYNLVDPDGPGSAGLFSTQLQADLAVGGSANNRWLACSLPLTTTLRDGGQYLGLAFALSNRQLLAVEEHRNGQDLVLDLNLQAYSPLDGTTQGQRQVRVPASTWQQTLQRLGTAVSVSLAIPVQGSDGALREAADYLLEARRLLDAGEAEKAIGSARQAMERVQAAADWPGITKADDLHQRSQQQRWRAIHKAAFDQASGAEHADDVTKDFRYSRAEAEALIAIAAALLRVATGPTLH